MLLSGIGSTEGFQKKKQENVFGTDDATENASDLVPPSIPYQEPENREDLQGPSQMHQE